MRETLAVTKALADETRLRILMMLGETELCVCQIIEVLKLAPSTVSKHLSILSSARLVESRKDGRWVYYRSPGPEADARVRTALAWLAASLAEDAIVRDDRQALAAILTIPRETLCRLQATR